ncbi:MAG: hypothetical protein HQL64_01870 [Magnetococcales bacterium]|nr:hypothetical protein [Magnetococcales bacterium]
MFKFLNHPSQYANSSELADFAESRAWLEGSFSAQALLSALGRNNENLRRGGPGDEDDANESLAVDVMDVVARRDNACNGAYPFRVEASGQLLRYMGDGGSESRANIYLYLLLCTRLDMQKYRKLDGKDGTALFEKLTADVLHNYLGGGRARSLVFGTAVPRAFTKKIDTLCNELGEGGAFRTLDADTTPASSGDGKLDVVAWVPFQDQRPGKLILFAQSKTGTHWRDTMTQLQPEHFTHKWMRNSIYPAPMRVFCVAEAVDAHWQNTQTEAGILFDRCRMVDFAHTVPQDTVSEIRAWTQEGKKLLLTEAPQA